MPAPVTRLVLRTGRPTGVWLALAAGPGLILAGLLAMGGLTAAPEDVGTVPSATTIEEPPGGARTAQLPVEVAEPPPSAPGSGRRPQAAASAAQPGAPVRLEFPRFTISAPVEPVGVDASGSLGVPENPDVLGWWRSGARPGGGRGAVVVDGHVDSARHGLGVFAKLAALNPGDAVDIVTAPGETHRYVVSGRRLYPKASLPTGEIFDQQGPERLVLVSCGGTFDKRLRKYSHNVVVYAVPER